MSKIKLIAPVSLAALALAASAASSASASTAGWMVNGSMLTGSKALMKKEPPPSEVKFATAEIEGKCGSTTLEGPEISAPNKGAASSIVFNECILSESACTLSSNEIRTAPLLLTEITLDGASAVQGTIKPETKSAFATVKFLGVNCSLSSEIQPIMGAVKVLDRTGQDEGVLHQILINSNKELKLGGAELVLHFAIFLSPVALETWSFL